MNRDIYIIHGRGALGVTKVIFDDTTPGDIILVVGGSQVDEALQCAIEETNIDPLDITTVQARSEYKTCIIPMQNLHRQGHQSVEAFFRDLWGDEVYDNEALSRDW